MKKLIIDANIIFSALRGKNSKTRNLILSNKQLYYSPNFLIGEIFKHKNRILHNSKASEEETYEYLLKVLNRVHFVNEEHISTSNFITAYRLCKDIDEKGEVY